VHRKRRTAWIVSIVCLCYIGLLLASALLAPLVAPFDPTEQHLDERVLKPGREGHLLGTDGLGRDVLSRIIYGSRSALVVGLVSVSIALVVGLVLGLLAGLAEGIVDQAVMLLMDALLSFPTVLLAITVVTFLGYGLPQVMLAMGVIFSPVFARLIRAETLAVKTEGFVESSRALGTPVVKIIYRHLLPNMTGRIVVQCAIIFALSVVIESSLSYLGLGTQPPEASWGLMLKDARNYLLHSAYLAVFPGLAIALTVLSFNMLGDAVADLL
jgi:ABC-type dipeptide/oligopeptide/nickel transport system permease subunit